MTTISTVSLVEVRRRVLWVVKGLGPGGAERLLAAHARAHDREAFDIECAYVLPGKDHLAEDLEQQGVATRCVGGSRRNLLWPWRLTCARFAGAVGTWCMSTRRSPAVSPGWPLGLFPGRGDHRLLPPSTIRGRRIDR